MGDRTSSWIMTQPKKQAIALLNLKHNSPVNHPVIQAKIPNVAISSLGGAVGIAQSVLIDSERRGSVLLPYSVIEV